jgi:hypothetical protein
MMGLCWTVVGSGWALRWSGCSVGQGAGTTSVRHVVHMHMRHTVCSCGVGAWVHAMLGVWVHTANTMAQGDNMAPGCPPVQNHALTRMTFDQPAICEAEEAKSLVCGCWMKSRQSIQTAHSNTSTTDPCARRRSSTPRRALRACRSHVAYTRKAASGPARSSSRRRLLALPAAPNSKVLSCTVVAAWRVAAKSTPGTERAAIAHTAACCGMRHVQAAAMATCFSWGRRAAASPH